MSKDFNGTTDGIDLGAFTVSHPCTWCCWTLRQGNGEGGLGALMGGGSAPGGGTFLRKASSGTDRVQFNIESPTSIVDATALSADSAFPADVWVFLAGSYVQGDGGPRIWIGDLDTPVAEVSYTSRSEATLTDGEGIVDPDIGRHPSPSMRYDGVIGPSSVWDGVLSVAQLNRVRIFPYAAMHKFGALTLQGGWPLFESAAAVALDHSGRGRHGTVTGTTVATEPPFAFTRRGVRRVLLTPLAAAAFRSFQSVWFGPDAGGGAGSTPATAGGFRSFQSIWFGPDAGGGGGAVTPPTVTSGRKLISHALAATIHGELT